MVLSVFDKMKIQKIISSDKKSDIPEKYCESIFQLMQKKERENHTFDPPKLDYFRKQWKISDLSWQKTIRFAGIDETDNVQAYAWLGFNIKYDNLDQAWFLVYLNDNEDKMTNRIIMLKEMVKSVPAQITKISTAFMNDSEGAEFYFSADIEPSYEEILFDLNLETKDLAEVSKQAKKLNEKALKSGYEIIFVEGLDYNNYVDYSSFVDLVECVRNDMPREELSIEDTKLNLERFNELCLINQKKWDTFYTFIAIHKDTGKPVGLTTSVLDNYQPHVAWQWDTGVLPEHRGNGLGLAMKYQMLETLLSTTKAKVWSTGSSSVNIHMHRINRALGYEKWDSEKIVDFTKTELEHFLEKYNTDTH